MGRTPQRTSSLLEALPDDGERRLMLAVLLDAIRIVRDRAPRPPCRRGGRVWQLTREWFEDDDRSYAFAFPSICDALGLNTAYVRGRVLGRIDPAAPRQRLVNICSRGTAAKGPLKAAPTLEARPAASTTPDATTRRSRNRRARTAPGRHDGGEGRAASHDRFRAQGLR